MKYKSHLLVEELSLAAGQEWPVLAPAWQVIRLQNGAGYWLNGIQSRSLSEGDMLVVTPGTPGSIRASLIGPLQLHAFTFDPNGLCGLLTVAERHFFAEQARLPSSPVRILAAEHPASGTFASLVTRPTHRGLNRRARLLALLGEIFDEELSSHTARASSATPASSRFRDLIERMTEVELLHHSPEELARLCGCTAPHFSRLFRKHFGASPRSRQTELRLQMASQLLLESGTKIIDVAFESGYRNLSLFNALFKRRYKMTPSAWRQRKLGALIKQGRSAAAVFTLAAFVLLGLQRAEPAAPGLTNSNPPATEKSPGRGTEDLTFEVKGYEVEGNTLLPSTVTTPLLQKYTGSAVTFDTIRRALADLQMAYRDRGFITVGVALPPQQLTNGLVRVQVTEGRLAEILVHGNRYFSSNNIMRALPSLRTNSLLNSLVFQQELDRANANRDRQIYPVINPGPEPGTSALELNIKDRLPLHGRLELDNYSTPNTPELRATRAIQYNNLWQLEHQVGLQYTFSPEEYKSGSFPFYDLPLIASYSVFYRMPLSAVNGEARTRDYDVGDFGYDEVTHRFRPPPVREGSELIFYASRSSVDTGHLLQSETLTPPTIPPEGALQVQDQVFNRSLTVNENLGARWSLPLPDLGPLRSSLSLGPDFKNFRIESTQDRTFQATVFVPDVGQVGPPFSEFPSPPTSSSRSLFNSVQYLPVTLLWEGSLKDSWGVTSLSLNQSANYGELLGHARDFRAIAGSQKANGNYYLVMAGASREQKLFGEWGLRLHADGQWVNQPLISNEQFALGGLAGVRGYRDGEEYGDNGWRVQFEPHTPIMTVGVVNGVPVTARLYTFVDYGERYLIDPGPRQGSVRMLGTGGGLDSSIGSHVDFRIVAGVPALDVPGRKSGDARVYFSVSAQY